MDIYSLVIIKLDATCTKFHLTAAADGKTMSEYNCWRSFSLLLTQSCHYDFRRVMIYMAHFYKINKQLF